MNKPLYCLLLLVIIVFTLSACNDNANSFVYTSNENKDGYTFSLNSDMEHVRIPETHDDIPITHIDQSVFMYPSVKTIHIPKHVTSMDFRMNDSVEGYYVDPDNEAYTSKDGVLFTSDYETLIHYPHGKTSVYYELRMPVKVIGENAFKNHPHLTNLFIGSDVHTIKSGAFSQMDKLALIESTAFLSELTVIEESAFAHSESVVYADFRSTKLQYVGPYAFEGMSELKTILFHEDAPLETLESGMFYLDKNLETISLPQGLKTIEYLALSGTKLISLHIGETLTTIDETSLIGMQNLDSITISEDNLTYEVRDDVLYDETMDTLIHLPMQKEISNLTISMSVDTIYYDSLHLNPTLETITFKGSVPPELLGEDIPYPFEFIVPEASLKAYKNAYEGAMITTYQD